MVTSSRQCDESRLGRLLRRFPTVRIINRTRSNRTTIVGTVRLRPSIIFLSIRVPEVGKVRTTGSLRRLGGIPLVVFTATCPRFTTRTFHCRTASCLLGPCSRRRLRRAVEQIRGLVNTGGRGSADGPTNGLTIRRSKRVLCLRPGRVLCVCQSRGMSEVVAEANRRRAGAPLGSLRDQLLPFDFFQVRGDCLIGLSCIAQLAP